jgi:hypothetical protein
MHFLWYISVISVLSIKCRNPIIYTDTYLTLRHTYVNNGGIFAYKENNKHEYMLEQINVFVLRNTNTPINGYVQCKDAIQRQ